MKKIFIVLAAVAMLASCKENEVVVYNNVDNEIGINVVNKKSVKSVFSTATYGKQHDFTVWANLSQTGAANEGEDKAANYSIAYLADCDFTNKEADHDCFKGKDKSYYWPKNGALMFAGVHPTTTELTSIFKVTAFTFDVVKDSLGIKGYTQPDPQVDSTDDLMFFPRTTSYVQPVGDVDTPHVAAVFQHTQSWLTFKVWAKTEAAQKYYTVDSIVVNTVNKRADLAVKTTNNTSTIEWKAYEEAADSSNVSVVKTAFNPYWKEGIAAADAKIVEDVKNGIIVIPQATTTATVTFSYNTQADQKVTETKTFDLTSTTDGNVWKPGKHYTYVISFDLKEILIDPTVTPWVEVEGNTLDI